MAKAYLRLKKFGCKWLIPAVQCTIVFPYNVLFRLSQLEYGSETRLSEDDIESVGQFLEDKLDAKARSVNKPR